MAKQPGTATPTPTPTPPSPRYDFPAEEVSRYFQAQWKLKQCEVCETPNRWFIGSPPMQSVLASSDGISVSTSSEKATLYVRVHCSNCGNTKLFLSETVRVWLLNNPPQSGP